ncbi:uncharacterized protein EHS24_002094 [Apiotrichum porosum]|uniref:Major facilitator superfamily (MFS) profile domain-containing protein n=1 Tax=Apiotrichum porosum TaxID=105984 RepID=A0A427XHJ4_9TREE|nr:uncharacterized protein EHS24_002094 [Apiotrichum porosum]RSH78369.1 hypothetical protein EHS24_002094 [Apiotrichum porosum]
MSTPSSTNTAMADVEAGKVAQPFTSRAVTYLQSQIDSKKCNAVSIYACFLTGFTSAVSFSACYIWCGFQTGNVAQLGIAVARNFDPIPERTYEFMKPDQQAFCSLLAFLLGTTLGRVGDMIGAKRRTWLVVSSFIQVLMAMAGALCAHYSGESSYAVSRGEPSWRTPLGMAALAFISSSMGLQGIIGKRVASPMNTTVVLTTTWVEIFNDPLLFAFKKVPSRDIRVQGVVFLILGSFVSRAIMGKIGSAGTLGVLCGFRLLQTLWWALTPSVDDAA